MTTRKVTRTFELTVEKSERLSIGNSQTFFDRCAVCASREEFVSPSEIARRFEITQREIFRLLEKENVGQMELLNGLLLICVKCIGSRV